MRAVSHTHQHTIRAKKSLGQNFLVDEGALSDIAYTIPIAGKNIIEVGPGYGALTEYIRTQNPHSLHLVELDKDMVHLLEKRYTFDENFQLHHEDILQFTPEFPSYSVIANIPYYITSPILFRFLYELPHTPESMVIMMQKEVGEKILSGREKKPHHSFLSLSMEQACENIDAVRIVTRESFEPAPKVDSIVLRFHVKKNRNHTEEAELLSLWKVAFTHPRKTLLSNLRSIYDIERIKKWLYNCKYDEKVRAEAINKADWKELLYYSK